MALPRHVHFGHEVIGSQLAEGLLRGADTDEDHRVTHARDSQSLGHVDRVDDQPAAVIEGVSRVFSICNGDP